MVIDLLVEGIIDEIVGCKVLQFCGHKPGTTYGKKGWTYIRDKLFGFNVRAQYGNPILVLVDFMDTGFMCPPELVRYWLPDRCPKLLLRVVVREIESWLLADRLTIADFLRVPLARVPYNPDQIPDPKQTLVNLARRSRSRRIREEIVPSWGSSSGVGPGYNIMIAEMVQNYWDVGRASAVSPSLNRCIKRLRELD